MAVPTSTAYRNESAKPSRVPVYILEFLDVDALSMYAPEVFRDSPVGYWRFGEAARDSVIRKLGSLPNSTETKLATNWGNAAEEAVSRI